MTQQTALQRVMVAVVFLLGIVLAVMHAPEIPVTDPGLSPQRQQHILYGDKTGGGHMHGAGRACKSEFPASWSARDIITTIKTVAANDNARWRREKNGYYLTEHRVGDVLVRVVVDAEKDDIITGYPLNQPRNACPARGAANDNTFPRAANPH